MGQSWVNVRRELFYEKLEKNIKKESGSNDINFSRKSTEKMPWELTLRNYWCP